MAVKIDKEQRVVDLVKKVVAYVDKKEKIIGVYSTPQDMRMSNSHKDVKELVKKYNYKIQMVIK
jgi:hypothetical protein